MHRHYASYAAQRAPAPARAADAAPLAARAASGGEPAAALGGGGALPLSSPALALGPAADGPHAAVNGAAAGLASASPAAAALAGCHAGSGHDAWRERPAVHSPVERQGAEGPESGDGEAALGSAAAGGGRPDSARECCSGPASGNPNPRPDSADLYPGGMAYAAAPAEAAAAPAEAAAAPTSPRPSESAAAEGAGAGAAPAPRDSIVQRGDSSMLDTMERGWHGCAKGAACACARGDFCACGAFAGAHLPPTLAHQQSGCMHEGYVSGAPLSYKRLPLLTWWVEAACAAGGVLLLPLLSLTPCSTSAVRADAVSPG